MPKRPASPKRPSASGKRTSPSRPKTTALTRPLVRLAPPGPIAPPPPVPAPVVVDAEVRTLPFTVDARQIPQSVKALAGDVAELVKKGRYTKVRLKLGSRPILPDIPVGVALAAGGLTAALVGPLQAVLGTMVGQIALQVELISDAAHHVTRGRELILAGELDLALEQFRTAVAIDRDHAPAHLNIGVALKLKGDREGARLSFERASALDPKGPSGLEAGKLLATLRGRD